VVPCMAGNSGNFRGLVGIAEEYPRIQGPSANRIVGSIQIRTLPHLKFWSVFVFAV
jgi:hypothetical protein